MSAHSFFTSVSRLSLLLLFTLLLLVLPLASSIRVVHANSDQVKISISFVGFQGSAWSVRIRGVVNGEVFECKGDVQANPIFEELRLIDPRLSVVSLYYTLASVCPNLLDVLMNAMSGSEAELSIHYPRGCSLRTGLDWRGYGPLGGPYTIPFDVFKRFHIYAWLVLVCSSEYTVYDDNASRITIIIPRDIAALAPRIASIAACGLSTLEGLLGESPMRAGIVVLADESLYPLIPSYTGLSTGYVIVIKIPVEHLDPWLLDVLVLHEVGHSWVNDGLLYGEPLFQEGVAQLLAWYAARRCIGDRGAQYLIYRSEGEYRSALRLHLALYNASLAACGSDLYMSALRSLFRASLGKPGGMIVDYGTFLDTIAKLAREHSCLYRLETLYGHYVFEARALQAPSSAWGVDKCLSRPIVLLLLLLLLLLLSLLSLIMWAA